PILQYQRSRADSAARKFWLGKDIAKDVTGGGQSNRLIPLYKLPPFAARVFGGENIDIKPMGQVLLDLGGRWQSIDNPQIPVQQQTNGGLFFDQQIRLSLAGKIGERVNINVNWDTKSTFQFENQFKIGYQIPTDDVGIIRELNVGNVSMQSSNSLIAAGQNLLGIQTRLQFGKLFLNAVASNTRGSQEVLVLKGGGQQRDFEIRADAYEFNRHFFLSDFFRNNYEKALETMPMITGGVIVTRVEVYVTNRVNNTQTLRNLAAFLDLGSTTPYKQNNGLIGTGGRQPVTDNTANDLYKNIENDPNIRSIDNVSNTLLAAGLEKGTDFDILRAARRLSPNEFLFNPQLGFVTLLT
ncbi:MAG: cell surface protein SprA, partial [Thermoflexibacteraceae bacterium]